MPARQNARRLLPLAALALMAASPAQPPAVTVHQGDIARGSVCASIITDAATRNVQDGGDVFMDNTLGGDDARQSWAAFLDRLSAKIGPEPPLARIALPDYVTRAGPIILTEQWRLPSGKNAFFGCVTYVGADNNAHLDYRLNGDPVQLMDELRAPLPR